MILLSMNSYFIKSLSVMNKITCICRMFRQQFEFIELMNMRFHDLVTGNISFVCSKYCLASMPSQNFFQFVVFHRNDDISMKIFCHLSICQYNLEKILQRTLTSDVIYLYSSHQHLSICCVNDSQMSIILK